MKIHFFSDVHVDVNRLTSPEEILDTSEKADLFIDAGDTGGYTATKNFYNHKFWKDKQAIFIGGNHLGYGEKKTLPEIENDLSSKFCLENRVSFLQNSERKFGNIIILGTTLWTDFNVFGNQKHDMRVCDEGMNDFRSILYTKDSYLTPKDSITLHNLSKRYIHNRLIKNKKYKFIIVTHHTPSLRSTSQYYMDNPLTAGFCNDMEDFIKQHDNILMWIHGHVHNTCSYMVGEVPVLCNPFGYRRFFESTGFVTKAVLDI